MSRWISKGTRQVILAIAACIVAVLVIGFIVLELDVRGHRSARYLVPFFLSAILIAVLTGINRGFRSLDSYFSSDFPLGFVCGGVFVMLIYGLICWVDPASRPRGSSATADQQRTRHRVN